jgi:DNA-binding MarR family transcriptional regulator
MAPTTPFARSTALEVRDQCLCFAAQRAARELARRFDRLFLKIGITNGQFSMMVAMGGMGQPKLGELGDFLGMDHATVTAAVRTLEKRRLVALRPDRSDRRARRVALTDEGTALINKAVPLWRAEHARLDAEFASGETKEIRSRMMRLAPPLHQRPAKSAA